MPKPSPHTSKPAAPRLLLLTLALCAAHALLPPAALGQRDAPASVKGRVTDGERGLPGMTVVLMSGDQPGPGPKPVARTKTDAEGRYQLTNVAPGRYQILPVAPSYVVQGLAAGWPPGRPLTLAGGDEVADVDFRVERGGVITGRVTDGDGNPVIGEVVTLSPADDKTRPFLRPPSDPRDISTDDRGVYRLYGLPAGRYRVSVGQGTDERGVVSYGRRKVFRRTYHPDATEAAEARVVEVRPGDEATDVDISVGRPLKTYKAAGRFVSAETGQPVPNVIFGYSTMDAAGRRIGGSYGGDTATNARGEFQTEGLAPGRYLIFSYPFDGSEFYSDPVRFEVTDADVSGLVVPLKRGANLSGVVQIEGLSDRAQAARMLAQLRITAYADSPDQRGVPTFVRPSQVAADGSFRLAGVRPGNTRLGVAGEGRGLSLSRVEVNGAPVSGGIPVAEGAQVSGVRVVMAYGSGVIRGQVGFANGTLPQGARVYVQARRVGAPGGARAGGYQAEADVRGVFRIEWLPAGEYEVQVRVFGANRVAAGEPERVSLAEGGEVSVSPVVDLGRLYTPPAGVPNNAPGNP